MSCCAYMYACMFTCSRLVLAGGAQGARVRVPIPDKTSISDKKIAGEPHTHVPRRRRPAAARPDTAAAERRQLGARCPTVRRRAAVDDNPVTT